MPSLKGARHTAYTTQLISVPSSVKQKLKIPRRSVVQIMLNKVKHVLPIINWNSFHSRK